MKKTVYLALGLASAAILTLSCNKQELPVSGQMSKISVGIEEQTKTVLDGVEILWSAGDQIDVISNGGGRASTTYTLTSGAGTAAGEFTGAHASTSAPYFIAYPYRAGNSKGGGTFNIDVPQVQYYAENSFGQGANPMVGVMQTLDSDVVLQNLFGVLRLALKGTVTITRIELTDLGGNALYGIAKCGLSSGALTMKYTMDDGGNTVNLNCGDGVTLNASTPTYFHICLPQGTLGSGCTIKLYNGVSLINTYTTNADHTITRGHVTAIAPITVEQGDIEEDVVTDLSMEGTANCYILYNEGNYKFKTVQGNTNTALSAASAEIIWETVNTTTAPSVGALVSDASYADGYITFHATGVKGNALIAAKDASGNIVWSWHIWIPESTITSASYSNGKTFMDRNLGALNATPGDTKTIGFIYEWGRKDPFMGMGSFSALTPIKATCTFTFATTDTTIEDAVANPTTYYSDKSQVHGTTRDWDTSRSQTKWGKTKTVYDPCPAGYIVPFNTYWDGIADPVYDATNHGWTVEGKHWYPFTGNIWASDLAYHSVTTNGYYWNSNTGTNQGQMLWITNTAFQVKKSTDRAQGLAIRCCSI